MSNPIIRFAILLSVAVIVVCGVDETFFREKRTLVGGTKDADLNDSQTQQASKAAKDALSELYGICTDALTATKATYKVTIGNVYNINYDVDNTACDNSTGPELKNCSATVYSFAGYTVANQTCTNCELYLASSYPTSSASPPYDRKIFVRPC